MKLIIYFALLFILLLEQSCQKTEFSPIADFPNNIGNKWEYQVLMRKNSSLPVLIPLFV